MLTEWQHLYITRFVLEAKSAFAINSGLDDMAYDTLLVRDANQLPTIPGTALAGVLRHRLQLIAGLEKNGIDTNKADQLFGYMKDKDQAAISRVMVSYGMIHNKNNIPVCERLMQSDIQKDEILERLINAHPFVRERVKINRRGVAQDTGKYDVTVMPAGCRFSFEICYWSEKADDPDWYLLLSLLQDPIFLGASTRSGLGCFEVVKIRQRQFNLGDKNSFKQYQALNMGLNISKESGREWKAVPDYRSLLKDYYPHYVAAFGSEPDFESDPESDSNPLSQTISLKLIPVDFWQFGDTGETILAYEKAPNSTTFREPRIEWCRGESNTNKSCDSDSQTAQFSEKLIVVPASSVKGALAHRTQFHLNRLTGQFIHEDQNQTWEDIEETQSTINLLFGYETAYQKTENHPSTKDLKKTKDPKTEKAKQGEQNTPEQSTPEKWLYTRDRKGLAGFIQISDFYLELPGQSGHFKPTAIKDSVVAITHNSLDRFTGGTRGHALFTEELIYQQPVTLKLTLDRHRFNLFYQNCRHTRELLRLGLKALDMALEDLNQQRLALGAGGAKGHGYFQAEQNQEKTRDKTRDKTKEKDGANRNKIQHLWPLPEVTENPHNGQQGDNSCQA